MGDGEARSPTSPTERPSLLLLLGRDVVAQRLIAAWPNVDRSGTQDDLIARWSVMANVRPMEVRQKLDMLFGHGFIREDGSVDELTDKFVQNLTVASLPPSVRPKSRKGPERKPDAGVPHAPVEGGL